MFHRSILLLAGCLILASTSNASCGLINVVAADQSSINIGAAGLAIDSLGGSAIRTVDGTGLGVGYPAFPDTHTGANIDGWLGHGSATDSDPWVHYDFGSVQSLQSMRFWNYNAASNRTRSIQNLDVYVSNNSAAFGVDTHSSWVLLNTITGIPLSAPNNATSNPYGVAIDLNNTNARYVRFDIIDTYGGQPAFAEVQFLDFEAVPEPSGVGLLACFGVAWLGRRRKRRKV